MDQEFLDSMVEEVNATQVSPEEVLSGHSYYYDFCNCLKTISAKS